MTFVAAILYAACAGLAGFVQLALVAGAPWGRLTMGGRWPARLPPHARILSMGQAMMLATMSTVVLGHGGVINVTTPKAVMVMVVFLTGLSCFANNLTPSRDERRLWGPTTGIMLVCSLVVWAGL